MALIVLNFEALSGPDLACAGHIELKSMRAVSNLTVSKSARKSMLSMGYGKA
jgi:hypothetical protein